jgi:hypothetical protein
MAESIISLLLSLEKWSDLGFALLPQQHLLLKDAAQKRRFVPGQFASFLSLLIEVVNIFLHVHILLLCLSSGLLSP